MNNLKLVGSIIETEGGKWFFTIDLKDGNCSVLPPFGPVGPYKSEEEAIKNLKSYGDIASAYLKKETTPSLSDYNKGVLH